MLALKTLARLVNEAGDVLATAEEAALRADEHRQKRLRQLDT